MIADKWDISRREMEEFALESNRRAIEAIDSGRFDREIVPVGEVRRDETPRRGTTSREDGDARAVGAGRAGHGRGREPDRGWCGGDARRERGARCAVIA